MSRGPAAATADLGTELGWDRSRLSHQLVRMENRGMVVREDCAEDARGLMVRITRDGRRGIEAAAPAHAEAVQRHFFDHLSRAEIEGVGFAGVCGFAGGFGRRMLNPWGEALIKQFVKEAIDHAVRLEQALAKLQTEKKVAVLHYAPIRATVVGEDPEIFPFMGSSRLEEPINRFRVSAVFHGHAHNGALEGKTATGIPVYNVSMPAVQKHATNHPPLRIVEV